MLHHATAHGFPHARQLHRAPFGDSATMNKFEILTKIASNRVSYPGRLSKHVKTVLRGLLTSNPMLRWGWEQVSVSRPKGRFRGRHVITHACPHLCVRLSLGFLSFLLVVRDPQSSEWMDHTDWDAVAQLRLIPPWKPDLKGKCSGKFALLLQCHYDSLACA